MEAEILHSGFDGLKFTIQTDIPPALRARLAEAKAEAIKTNRDCLVEFGSTSLAVRRSGGSAFSCHTGEYGAEWYFLDPENRPVNNPGVAVDFRAFLLATGGLRAAEAHFREYMAALAIPYVETQLRVSRVDYAIDILAPWYEPDREALVMPSGTRVTEYTGIDATETVATGARVTGLRAGKVSNRQLAIYDKRAEVIAKGKMGWLAIWNDARAKAGKPPLDLKDRNTSQVWRFELRMGSKQLRNKFEMRSWQDLYDMIGDAYADFSGRMRYCVQATDSNRSRWPTHELWEFVEARLAEDLIDHRSGVLPNDVKTTNHAEHKRMLDRQALGILISRAAASGVSGDEFGEFLNRYVENLEAISDQHSIPITERILNASARYVFK